MPLDKLNKGKASLSYLHWIIVFLSLVLTLAASYASKVQVDQNTKLQFERESEQVLALVEERMAKYEEALWAGVATIAAQNYDVNNDAWLRFSEGLKINTRYPGINGIGVIYHIQPDRLQDYLKEQRAGRPDFKIHPKHNNNEYWPITYIEPIADNAAAVGLDMAHEKNRHEAAKKSRETGESKITAPITLVQDSEKTPGFLFYAPFYKGNKSANIADRKKNFQGLVYAPFIVNKLMKGTLKKENRHIGIKIHDEGNIIYNEHLATEEDYDPNPQYTGVYEINFYGRIWSFDLRSAKSFRGANRNNQPIIILTAGIIIDILLLMLFYNLSKSRQKALNLAYKMNEDLLDTRNFQDLIKNANPDLIFVKDKDFVIVDANKAFLDLYPKEKRDKIIGYTTLEEYDEDEAEQFLEQDKIAFEEGNSEIIEDILFPNGENRILSTKKTRFKNIKGQEFILGISHDITEREKLMEDLKISNSELDDFAYISSHDLKEPLRGIHNHAHFLERDYLEKIDDKGQHKIDRIKYLTKRMERIINDLLYYSRLGRSEIAYKETNLNEVAVDIKEMILASNDGDVEITIKDTLPTIFCDKVKIEEVFRNLISNAIKYNEKDKKVIEVGLDSTKNRNDDYVIYIQDNGIGIKEKNYEDIFKIFRRLHRQEEYGGGSGSGLTFVKKIIDRHNGKIWLESDEGKGTKFYLRLPISRSQKGEK